MDITSVALVPTLQHIPEVFKYRGWTKKLKHLVLLHNNLLEW